ncbi:MAG: glucoamylase family protein [Sphingobacteriaceae bacterium]
MKPIYLILICFFLHACSKSTDGDSRRKGSFSLSKLEVNEQNLINDAKGVTLDPRLVLTFDEPINQQDIQPHIRLLDSSKAMVGFRASMTGEGRKISIQPDELLNPLTRYQISISSALKSANGTTVDKPYDLSFTTAIDSSDKFDRFQNRDDLLDLIQRQTFSYFWDFAHPSSGMIRERSSSNETVTTGGTGFGIMAIVTAVHRDFISHAQGLGRLKKIVDFLAKADRYHGAFSHWYNGATGETQPFSEKDDGADLVETGLLIQGLLAARAFFDDPSLNLSINKLIEQVEWSHFQNGQEVLFWHWSPNHAWDLDLKIQGWNESLIVYVLAAGSSKYSIDKPTYDQGWAGNGKIRNGKSFFDITLPLGPDYGGPLFTTQYSFLGLNPNGLRDEYADYGEQAKNQTLINRAYCMDNPLTYYGYSEQVWGLSAGDIPSGYGAQSPSNDIGVIAPTAAIASLPYTPEESIEALEFFYYKLGDRLWGQYGFKDGFSLDEGWFSESYLAIDQGPIIIGIENYRSGLIWDLVMAAPEIRNGLNKLGFTSTNN